MFFLNYFVEVEISLETFVLNPQTIPVAQESNSDDERSPSQQRKTSGVDLPPDPYLLLSLVYFDTSRCGYIVKKDLQNLFMSLGLRLSRSQIRTILEKVCVKENFTYKSV